MTENPVSLPKIGDPAPDFTPVCTTELIGTKLIGVSVDSVHAHLSWIQNIREKMGAEVQYPLVADSDMKVASLYGMIHPGASSTATVRAVFVIDPKRIVRAIIYYPMNAGRNIDEIVCAVKALQTADIQACATPANWRPGDKVVVPPPKTVAQVADRLSRKDTEIRDFYLSMKELAKSQGAAS